MDPLSDPLGAPSAAWEAAAGGLSLPRYRGRQIFDALHRQGVRDWAEVRTLPADLRSRLAAEAPLRLPEIARRESSSDGSVKYGLRYPDGALVEAVFMPGDSAFSAAYEFEDARAAHPSPAAGARPGVAAPFRSTPPVPKFTVCLSSQTGCAVDCAFCVTGRLGGGRNLTAGEIVGQLYTVLDDAKATICVCTAPKAVVETTVAVEGEVSVVEPELIRKAKVEGEEDAK